MQREFPKTHTPWREVPHATLRWVLAVLLAAVFLVLAICQETELPQQIDDQVRLWAYSIRTPATNRLFLLLTHLAGTTFIVGVIAVLLIIPATRKRVGIPQACYQAVFFLVYRGLKSAFARPRPDSAMWLVQEHGWSFPSGHSMNGMVFYGLLAFLAVRNMKDVGGRRWLAAGLLCLPFLIAFIRVYLGVHYLTDVLGGLAAGGCEVLIAGLFMDYFHSEMARS